MTVSNANDRHPILDDEEMWEGVASEVLGPRARLIAVSNFIADSRVYRLDETVAKIRRRSTRLPEGVAPLQDEAHTLEGLGWPVELRRIGEFDVLLEPNKPGMSLAASLHGMSMKRRIRVLAQVASALRDLHRRGIAHRDLRLDNVLIAPSGSSALVDFDRALAMSPRGAFWADWLGVGRGQRPSKPFWKLVMYTLAPRLESIGQRIRAIRRRRRPITAEQSMDPDARLLVAAWEVAAKSRANAPGQHLAYYSFTYRGLHLPGERPWDLRWEAIRTSVDLRDRKILELGCNMGLLSINAVIHGAKSAIAIDRDGEILDAARLVAKALRVEVAFEQVDIVRDAGWEERLIGADLVVAMSLLHWLPDPARLLAFLARHREVLYEGHDSTDLERSRLEAIGFTTIRELGSTERGRPLLHASRL
jgi:2-polyprenyl-3-methyl-5-hydroxy-6-metoxy-1,4-benzoquinol methylase